MGTIDLKDIPTHFPSVDFAIAYGSGVFKQKNQELKEGMIDMVFAVNDPIQWHHANLERNPNHYSSLKYLGANTISKIQDNYGAGIYYNTHVKIPIGPFSKRLMKYGIISTETLIKDLQEWRTLYISGRMHKPVQILKICDQVKAASDDNLNHALRFALLKLPEKFSDEDLFMAIAGISYTGDFRMVVGENPKKVFNIVKGSKELFCQLYKNTIKESSLVQSCNFDSSLYVRDCRVSTQQNIISNLPLNVRNKLMPSSSKDRTVSVLAQDIRLRKKLDRAIASIVSRPSKVQGVKGILTAGVLKSCLYIAEKLQKMVRGRT